MNQHFVWTTWYVLYLENLGIAIYGRCHSSVENVSVKTTSIVRLVVKPLRLKDPTFCLLVFDAFCCFVQQIYIGYISQKACSDWMHYFQITDEAFYYASSNIFEKNMNW